MKTSTLIWATAIACVGTSTATAAPAEYCQAFVRTVTEQAERAETLSCGRVTAYKDPAAYCAGRGQRRLAPQIAERARRLDGCAAARLFCEAYADAVIEQARGDAALRCGLDIARPRAALIADCRARNPKQVIGFVTKNQSRLLACQAKVEVCSTYARISVQQDRAYETMGCSQRGKWGASARVYEDDCRARYLRQPMSWVVERAGLLDQCIADKGLPLPSRAPVNSSAMTAAAQAYVDAMAGLAQDAGLKASLPRAPTAGPSAAEAQLEQFRSHINRLAERMFVRQATWTDAAVDRLNNEKARLERRLAQGICVTGSYRWGARVKRCERKCLQVPRIGELCADMECLPIPGTGRKLCPVCGFEIPRREIEICTKRVDGGPQLTVNGKKAQVVEAIASAAAGIQREYVQALSRIQGLKREVRQAATEAAQRARQAFETARQGSETQIEAQARQVAQRFQDTLRERIRRQVNLRSSYAYLLMQNKARNQLTDQLSRTERPRGVVEAELMARGTVIEGLQTQGAAAAFTVGEVFLTEALEVQLTCWDGAGDAKRTCYGTRVPIALRDGLFDVTQSLTSSALDAYVYKPLSLTFAQTLAGLTAAPTGGLSVLAQPVFQQAANKTLSVSTYVMFEQEVRPIYNQTWTRRFQPHAEPFARSIVDALPAPLFE